MTLRGRPGSNPGSRTMKKLSEEQLDEIADQVGYEMMKPVWLAVNPTLDFMRITEHPEYYRSPQMKRVGWKLYKSTGWSPDSFKAP